MPIASTLEADFSEFVSETQKANVALSTMQREADKTATAVGGTASAMNSIGGTTNTATGGVLKLAKGFGTAENALTALGVAGASQVSNLGQLATSAAGAATSFGLVGSAAAVAATALSGWKVGRLIAEANELDKVMANLGATFMGWGSVSKETAGAQQDLIDRAKQLTGVTYDAATAAKVVADAVKDQQAQFLSSGALTKQWQEDLRNARGGLSSLRQEIEAGNMTQDQLRAKYKVSAEALQFLTREMGKEKTARAEVEREAKAQAEAMTEVNQAITGQEALLDTLTDSERAATEAALAAGVAQGTVAKAFGLSAPQVRAVADAMKEVEAAVKGFDAAQKVVSDANAKWNDEIVSRSMSTTAQLTADIERWRTEAIEALDATEHATQEQYDKIEAIAAEKLSQVLLDWNVLKEGAIATHADMAARAEATYQEMLAHSTRYSTGAIEQAKQVRDETLATYEAMTNAHSAALADYYKRDKAYADALKQFQTEAATAQETAYQKQTAALDAAIAYSQTYAVTITEAQQALGQMGDSGEQAGQRTAQAMAGAAQQVGQLTAMVQQSAAQMDTLAAHYEQLASQTMQGGGTGLGWSPWQVGTNYQESARKLREQAGRARQYENAIAPEAWTRGNALTVTVNNADAQGIANKLVEEMRHAGVRFG